MIFVFVFVSVKTANIRVFVYSLRPLVRSGSKGDAGSIEVVTYIEVEAVSLARRQLTY